MAIIVVPKTRRRKSSIPSEIKYIGAMWGGVVGMGLMGWGLDLLNQGLNSTVLSTIVSGINNALSLVVPVAGGVTVAFFAIPVIKRLIRAFRGT